MNSSGSRAAGSAIAHASPDLHVLARLATSFDERLPLGLPAIRALLASDGCPVECRQFADLVRYYRVRGATVPFRIVTFGGMEVAVAREQSRLASQVGAAAVRMVQHWGLVGVQQLTERTETVSTSLIPRTFVEKLLAALPATRWLDAPGSGREWFSFAGRQTGLSGVVDKLMGLGRCFALRELRTALARTSTAVNDAPSGVLERYLVEIAGCEIVADRVSAPAHDGPPPLTKPEATLVDILRGSGGRLDPSTLRRRAAAAALPDATLTRLLRFSALVCRMPDGEVALLGEEAAAHRDRPVPATGAAPARSRPLPTGLGVPLAMAS